jgi:hypothetical protein
MKEVLISLLSPCVMLWHKLLTPQLKKGWLLKEVLQSSGSAEAMANDSHGTLWGLLVCELAVVLPLFFISWILLAPFRFYFVLYQSFQLLENGFVYISVRDRTCPIINRLVRAPISELSCLPLSRETSICKFNFPLSGTLFHLKCYKRCSLWSATHLFPLVLSISIFLFAVKVDSINSLKLVYSTRSPGFAISYQGLNCM